MDEEVEFLEGFRGVGSPGLRGHLRGDADHRVEGRLRGRSLVAADGGRGKACKDDYRGVDFHHCEFCLGLVKRLAAIDLVTLAPAVDRHVAEIDLVAAHDEFYGGVLALPEGEVGAVGVGEVFAVNPDYHGVDPGLRDEH